MEYLIFLIIFAISYHTFVMYEEIKTLQVQETFITEVKPYVSQSVEEDNTVNPLINIDMNGYVDSLISELHAYIPNVLINSSRKEYDIEYNHIYSLDVGNIITALKEPQLFIMIAPKRYSESKQRYLTYLTLDEMIIENNTIGYTNENDLVIFNLILQANKLENKATLKKVILDPEIENNIGIQHDAMFLMVKKSDSTYKWLSKQEYAVVEYYNSDNDELFRYYFPHSKVSPVLLDIPGDKNVTLEATTASLLHIDIVLISKNKQLTAETVKEFTEILGSNYMNMYLSQLFGFFEPLETFITEREEYLSEMEKWNDLLANSADHILGEELPKSMVKEYKEHKNIQGVIIIILKKTNLNGVNLQVGDRVLLTNEKKDIYNSFYYVQKYDKHLALVNCILFRFDSLQNTLFRDSEIGTKGGSAHTHVLLEKKNDRNTVSNIDVILGDRIYVTNMDGKESFGRVTQITEKTIKITLTQMIDRIRYICHEDPAIITKELCEATIDPYGNEKAKFTWDKPCVFDTDCPFYEPNKSGGCKASGYCDLPPTVEAKGFRYYQ